MNRQHCSNHTGEERETDRERGGRRERRYIRKEMVNQIRTEIFCICALCLNKFN